MINRKYISEFALGMIPNYVWLLQQDGLDHLAEYADSKDYPCHIYMVGRRPRVTLDPSAFQIDEYSIRGRFKIQRQEHFETHDFIFRNQLGTRQLRLECSYPYTEFALYNQEDTQVFGGKAALIAHRVATLADLLTIEILYVGQSYGTEGSRLAPERLRSHSTLQSIYAEAMRRSPDQEIWLLLLSLDAPILLMAFDGRNQNHLTSNEEDDAHIQQVAYASITDQLCVNFTEAALIRYFEPEYNKEFKSTFPNPMHTTYAQCYEIDLHSVAVSLETACVGCRLKSAKVPPQWEHFIWFPLHSPEERNHLFAGIF